MYGAFSDDTDEPKYIHNEAIVGGRRYCYFDADVPRDCEEGDADARFELAILQAREAFPDFVSPCNWEPISDIGDTVKICRVSGAYA